jgi:hypothetical protein
VSLCNILFLLQAAYLTRLVVYYPFSSVIAIFIAIMRNPRQPSAKSDLDLITAATRLFEQIHVRSDLSEKMSTLTRRFQMEASNVLERLNRQNQEEVIQRLSPLTTGAASRPRNSYEGNLSCNGMGSIREHSGRDYISRTQSLQSER